MKYFRAITIRFSTLFITSFLLEATYLATQFVHFCKQDFCIQLIRVFIGVFFGVISWIFEVYDRRSIDRPVFLRWPARLMSLIYEAIRFSSVSSFTICHSKNVTICRRLEQFNGTRQLRKVTFIPARYIMYIVNYAREMFPRKFDYLFRGLVLSMTSNNAPFNELK